MAAMAKQGRKDAPAGWLGSPLFWAAATVATVLAAYTVVKPTACSDVKECVVEHDSIPARFNSYAATGLAMVLVGETANLISTYNGAREAQAMIPDLRSRCLPSLLLVISFVVLICESSVFAASSTPWFASARPDFKGPVYNVTFIEWLIIVPMLLTMAGHCALGRPMKELGRPIVVTNVYIVLSWVALLTTSSVLRWSLVVATLLMYAWASLDMVIWVAEYLRAAPLDLSSRSLRPCLSLGLIALFAVYAVIYMFVLFGTMGAHTERMLWLCLNVGSKLSFSVAFVVIRGNEYHSTLTGVLKKLSTSNVAIVSILRGSFDILLPCVGDLEGRCKLARTSTGDMKELEHTLQRPVAGLCIGDLLSDDTERDRFAAYVRNARCQAEAPKALGGDGNQPDWTLSVGGELPPVAQVLNCRFALGEESAAEGAKAKCVSCAVHLSVVPNSSLLGSGRQMVAAVRFTEDSAVPRAEEAVAAPEFESFEPHSGAGTDSSTCGDEAGRGDHRPNSNDRMIASLMDVARLGMSALLRSACSVSGDGEEESGYDDDNSCVEPRKPSKGTRSGTFIKGKAQSVISEEESEDSVSVVKKAAKRVAKPDAVAAVAAPERQDQPRSPRALSVASSSVSRAGPFQRLSTLLEPEEEQFSRNTTGEEEDPKNHQVSDGALHSSEAPKQELPHEPAKEAVQQPVQQAVVTYPSVQSAVAGVVQELTSPSLSDSQRAVNATVTVTMRMAPLQFGVAVSALTLAAATALLSVRRRG